MTRSSARDPLPRLDVALKSILRSFVQADPASSNAEIPIYLYGETRTSQHIPNDILKRVARLHSHVRGHAGVCRPPHHSRGQELPGQPGAAVLPCAGGVRPGWILFMALPWAQQAAWRSSRAPLVRCSISSLARTCCEPTCAMRSRNWGSCSTTRGRLRPARSNAARIFNADHCLLRDQRHQHQSNKMVWHHTVAPGDVVVVDRNCHKSILHSASS